MNQTARDFFVAGGTLPVNASSYVERPADQELREHIETGELCYVLTTRQMGKSSLMARTAAELRTQGLHTAIIDLSSIGSKTAQEEQWYLSILDDLKSQLPFTSEVEEWWEENSSLSYVRRFTKFFQEVLFREVDGRIIIFVDEIDSVLNLDFADDFFAAIRALYNRDSLFLQDRRLSFVLLGVAAPDDLIKDRTRTPFNVGIRIDLNELTLKDAGILLLGLPENGGAILERIFYWTNGHPYLTQRIGKAIARDNNGQWDNAAVDELVASLFFTNEAVAQESNLQFVGRRVLSSPNKARLLRLYRDIYRGKPIKSVEQSPYQNELKLYGLVRNDKDGQLEIRNRIYEQVFDGEWIKENAPEDPWRRVAIIAVAAMVIFLLGFAYYWQQRPIPDAILAQSYIAGFQETQNPTVRLSSLANLAGLEEYSDDVIELFNSLSTNEQEALFENATPDLTAQAKSVASKIYMTLYTDDFGKPSQDSTRVLQAILNTLERAGDAESEALRNEIKFWLIGRRFAEAEDYPSAKIVYDLVISENPKNPATRIERALVLASLEEYRAALRDLADVLKYGSSWEQAVANIVTGNNQFVESIYALENPAPFTKVLPASVPDGASSSSLSSRASTVRIKNNVFSRTGPGLEYPISDSFSAGAVVPVIGRDQSGSWFLVEVSRTESAWVSANFVSEPNMEPLSIPIAATIPAQPPPLGEVGVSANQGWQNTGISFQQGARVLFRVVDGSGRIRRGRPPLTTVQERALFAR